MRTSTKKLVDPKKFLIEVNQLKLQTDDGFLNIIRHFIGITFILSFYNYTQQFPITNCFCTNLKHHYNLILFGNSVLKSAILIRNTDLQVASNTSSRWKWKTHYHVKGS